jgi:DNA-3-methyladenine glycosylase
MKPLPRSFYDRDSLTVARDLVGRFLVRELNGARFMGRIVEVEAYDPTDPASHSFRGPTTRNRSMFGPPGHAYVYRSHGIHRCLNVVSKRGSAVLIRALEPIEGSEEMARRRGLEDPRLLCAGPGRLCQAFGIDMGTDGADLTVGEGLWLSEGRPSDAVVTTPRIGITRAADKPWRFVEEGSPYASRRV